MIKIIFIVVLSSSSSRYNFLLRPRTLMDGSNPLNALLLPLFEGGAALITKTSMDGKASMQR